MHTVNVDVLVNASPDKVWSAVGPFDSVAKWHPHVSSCDLSKDDQGRMVRTLTFKNGQQAIETCTSFSDQTKGYTYGMTKAKLPVQLFSGQFQVVGNGDQSHVFWTATFEVVPGFPEDKALEIINGIFQAAKPGLQALFG